MTLALAKKPSHDKAHKHKSEVVRNSSITSQSTNPPLSFSTIQRKPSCPCGGGCPKCKDAFLIQPKLKISEPGDNYEQEADRLADEIMRMPDGEIFNIRQSDTKIQRKCSTCASSLDRCPECEEENLGLIQRNVANADPSTEFTLSEAELPGTDLRSLHNDNNVNDTTVPDSFIHKLGPGQPLDILSRSFFERRFAYDFSNVRIHRDSSAARSAEKVNAHAYTLGNDVVFGQGQYAPETSGGRRLLAHELTHVAQQSLSKNLKPYIQRMIYGDGVLNNPPSHWVNLYNARVAPQQERNEVVDESISMIRETVENRERYRRCHGFFQERCPGGNPNTFLERFDQAVLWKANRQGALAFAEAPGRHIAYTQGGYEAGARGLGATLVHELMHNCGISGEDEHYLADVAGLYCIGPASQFAFALGLPQGGSDLIAFLFSYRRLLADLGSGQRQLTLGADINIVGVTSEIGSLLSAVEPESAEFCSVLFGLRLRGQEDVETGVRTDFGGERFGGAIARLELGASVGRFRVEESRESPPGSTEILPGFVVQGGLGVEFYIPIGVNAVPLSLEATYRMVQPLNPEAERIHGLFFNLGLNL